MIMKTLGIAVLMLVAGFVGALVAPREDRSVSVDTLDIYEGKPMPCERDQQFVWITYPSEALCLDMPTWRRDEPVP